MADLSDMRKSFLAGDLRSAIVEPLQNGPGWKLKIVRKDGSVGYLTVARRTRHKVYKSLQSAHEDAYRVGFPDVLTTRGDKKVA